MTTKWVYRIGDGAWMVLGFGDPGLVNTQPSLYAYADVPGVECPDPRLTRYSGPNAPPRPATAAEIKQYDDVMVRDKALGDTCIAALAAATHKRFMNLAPVDSMTAQQWEAAIKAEWDRIRNLR